MMQTNINYTNRGKVQWFMVQIQSTRMQISSSNARSSTKKQRFQEIA